MMKTVLFCATVDEHFKGFHIPYLKWFKEQGWEVHVAANGNMDLPFVDRKYNLPIQRSPFNLKNIQAFKELKLHIKQNKYELIHCHTPMGGVLGRLAARNARSKGTKVIYTAHGFHFCKGAPLKNWLLYYPIEKMLANYTDCLITINQEDYYLATHRHFRAGTIEQVHGVGIDSQFYQPLNQLDKNKLRAAYGYKENDFLMFYAAEFNQNKNQQLLIHLAAIIKDEIPNSRLLLAGDGPHLEKCKTLSKELGVEKMVDFLGFRDDIPKLLPMCDIAAASSLREGLPVNIMEAMSCGLPIIASDNRGHRELVANGRNGWLIDSNNLSNTVNHLINLSENDDLIFKMGSLGRKAIENTYSINNVLIEMVIIYKRYMGEMGASRWEAH